MQSSLINPTCSEIRIISKRIIDNINKQIISIKELNQWISSDEVLTWFRNLKKGKYKLLKLDNVNFYPSISENLWRKALTFGKVYEKIENNEIKIIMNATKSVLYHQQQVWIKTNNHNSSKLFDVTMREKHGAEVCELAGLYILNGIKSKRNGTKVGIYKNIDL